MVKILGYKNSEISRLYIQSTAVVVFLCLIISLPMNHLIMKKLFISVLMSMMPGWITYYVAPAVFVKIVLAGSITYGAVAALEYRRIRRVPMGEALKNVE